jgi:hypothetical protein
MKLSAFVVLALALVSCNNRSENANDAPNPAAQQPPGTTSGGSVSQSKYEVIAYKYHPGTRILNLRLSGGYYRFSLVPQAAYDAFVMAGADARAYEDTIDGKFKAEYIREDPAWMRAGQPKDAGL